MSATIEIDEQNGAPTKITFTHNIRNSNMGTADSANLDPIANPIPAGRNSYEKWQLIHVIDMGTSTKINNIQVWRSGELGNGAIHLTNAVTTGYSGTQVYNAPSTETSKFAVHDMPTSPPGSANLGIDGSLGGSLTAAGYSDFLVHQIQTSPSALSGSITTMNYQYDETA